MKRASLFIVLVLAACVPGIATEPFRMSLKDDNYRVYKVVDGKRSQVASAEVKAPAGKWYHLRVVQQGDHIRCYLDGKPMLDVHDGAFTAAGKIGLWTKADAVTQFDDLRVKQPAAAETKPYARVSCPRQVWT